jgi:hypothetical protein
MLNKNYINLININKYKDKKSAVFMDTVDSVASLLDELGFETNISNNVIIQDAINIIWGVGTHFSPEFEEIESIASPSNTIIFNMEQINSGSPLITDQYLDFLSKYIVLDYNQFNLDKLKGLRNIVGFEFPLLPTKEFLKEYDISKNFEKKYDLGFYGYLNERREKILRQFDGSNLNIKIFTGLYGQKLAEEISDCKVVLNIHAYDTAIFEIARCLRPLAMGIPIVSEVSVLPSILNWKDSGIRFVETEKIAISTYELLNNSNALLANLQKSLYFINARENKMKIKNLMNVLQNLF